MWHWIERSKRWKAIIFITTRKMMTLNYMWWRITYTYTYHCAHFTKGMQTNLVWHFESPPLLSSLFFAPPLLHFLAFSLSYTIISAAPFPLSLNYFSHDSFVHVTSIKPSFYLRLIDRMVDISRISLLYSGL